MTLHHAPPPRVRLRSRLPGSRVLPEADRARLFPFGHVPPMIECRPLREVTIDNVTYDVVWDGSLTKDV